MTSVTVKDRDTEPAMVCKVTDMETDCKYLTCIEVTFAVVDWGRPIW